jgi:hypothetical protein
MSTIAPRPLLAAALALLAAGCGGADPTPQANETASVATGENGVEGVPPPSESVSQTTATPSALAANTSPIACSAEIGAKAAAALVAQCRAVSPATHPPCNAANSCAMIRNEVARGCAVIGADATGTPECGGIDPVGREAAADMVERYYAAINAHDYASAWVLWGEGGGGKTLDAFTAGFAQTRRTHVDIGKVSDVEGGAGSIYVTVPVTVDAELADGRRQRFTGSYALRQINRGMGVSQGWHITTASLRPS